MVEELKSYMDLSRIGSDLILRLGRHNKNIQNRVTNKLPLRKMTDHYLSELKNRLQNRLGSPKLEWQIMFCLQVIKISYFALLCFNLVSVVLSLKVWSIKN